MGVSLYCDNCGNKASHVNTFQFGQCYGHGERISEEENHKKWQIQQMLQATKNTQSGNAGSINPSTSHGGIKGVSHDWPTYKVELCVHCSSGWITRVMNLTRKSDPDVKS